MARVFPFILGVKYKTLHVKSGLDWVGKIYRKLICTRFDRSSLADLAYKSCNSLDSNFTNKHTLSSLNPDSKFWSWFANTLHIEVLVHLVPKDLEPNKYKEIKRFNNLDKGIKVIENALLIHISIYSWSLIFPNYYMII